MSKRTVRAAKKIMIAHKYHNQISEFYYPGPGAQSSNFFYVSISLSVMQSDLYGTPNTQPNDCSVQITRAYSPEKSFWELDFLCTGVWMKWLVFQTIVFPCWSSQLSLNYPLRNIFTLITHCLSISNSMAFPLSAHLPLSFVLVPSLDQRVLSSEQQFTPGLQPGQGRKRGCCFCLCGLET